MPSDIRIAHLSDLHLPLGMPSGLEWLGKRGLSGLSWHLRRHKLHRAEIAERLLDDLLATPHDLVAMTGDLTNFGLEREFAASRAWLERLGPPEKVFAIPGNHEALARPWQGAMARHWQGYCEDRVLSVGAFCLIGVSSAVTTPPLMASGRITRAGLDRLAGHLSNARASGRRPIVLIHHAPTDISIRRKSLANRDAVAKVLADGGAALVLHGHTHLRELSWIDAPHGRIPVLGVPSFSMSPRHHPCPGAWRLVHGVAEDTGAHITIEEHTITNDGGVHTRSPLTIALPTLAPR